jgi:hypothetical protein
MMEKQPKGLRRAQWCFTPIKGFRAPPEMAKLLPHGAKKSCLHHDKSATHVMHA